MAVITKEIAYSYAELLEILEYTDPELVAKVPQKMIGLFNKYADPEYERHINSNIPIESQKLSKKTYALIGLLLSNYWCDTPETKQELEEILAENQRKLDEKYSYDKLFDNNSSTSEVNEVSNETNEQLSSDSNLPMDYANMVWYKKIGYKVRIFLKNLLNTVTGKKETL